jgi:hypothetical protein
MEIGTTHDPIFLVHKTKKAIYKIDDFPVFLLYGVPNPGENRDDPWYNKPIVTSFLVHKIKKAIYKIDDFPVFLLYGVPNPD